VYGCRVINVHNFITEVFYLDTLNLWSDLVKSEEAIQIK